MKLQDQAVISPDDIQFCNCPICNAVLLFTRNENDQYYSTHCDRKITLNCVKYQATIIKDQNVKLPKPDESLQNHKIGHPEKIIKWRRYI